MSIYLEFRVQFIMLHLHLPPTLYLHNTSSSVFLYHCQILFRRHICHCIAAVSTLPSTTPYFPHLVFSRKIPKEINLVIIVVGSDQFRKEKKTTLLSTLESLDQVWLSTPYKFCQIGRISCFLDMCVSQIGKSDPLSCLGPVPRKLTSTH